MGRGGEGKAREGSPPEVRSSPSAGPLDQGVDFLGVYRLIAALEPLCHGATALAATLPENPCNLPAICLS
jgi:hypothetical protein